MSKKPTSNPLIKAVRKSAARFATKPSGISHAGKGLPMNKLVFTSMPSTGSTGTNLSSIAVTVKTPSGQTVNTTLLVTLSLSSGPGRFSTGVGAVARNCVAGVATFTGLRLPTNGTYRLTASAPNTSWAVSGPLTISTAAATNHAPTDISLSSSTVAENQAVGTAVGSFSTTDQDTSDTFTYSLVSGTGSTDNASFTISGSSLLTAAMFDYETKSSYAIRVRTTDNGGLTFEKQFTITVADLPDTPGTTLTSWDFTTGWATFGLVVPEGQADESLRIGDLETQVEIRNRWLDNSIRFAQVTAYIPSDDTYDIVTAPVSSGSITPTLPKCTVTFTSGGQTYVARIPSSLGSDVWMNGSLVREDRFFVVPTTGSGVAHQFLTVYFDVRMYRDGRSRVDVHVWNRRHIALAELVTYDVSITDADGTVLYSKANVSHFWLTGWRKVFHVGSWTPSSITPDFEPFYEADALPEFLSTIVSSVLDTTGSTWDILGRGFLLADMGTVGGRQEIAILPGPVARYLVHKTQAQRAVALKIGDLGPSWPRCPREADDSLFTIDNHPGYWLDYRGDAGNKPPSGITCPNKTEINHLPTMVYAPYLLTGDRFYADEMENEANWCLLWTYQNSGQNQRGGAQGLLKSNQVRGNAWGLRCLVEAATYLPDAWASKAYFTEKVNNNLTWYQTYAGQQLSPIGESWEDKRPENNTVGSKDHMWVARWEHNYLTWVINWAHKQGFTGGSALLDRMGQMQLSLFTAGSDFDRRYAAAYRSFIGTYTLDSSGNRILSSKTYYTSLAQSFSQNFVNQTTGVTIAPPQFQGSYGADARLMLIIGIEKGWSGAQAAYDWLHPQMAETPYIGGYSDLNNNQPGWGVKLRS